MTLEERLREAHARHDKAALTSAYAAAALEQTDVDAKCFFLTHAYVFALDAGDPRAEDLRAQLILHGREPAA